MLHAAHRDDEDVAIPMPTAMGDGSWRERTQAQFRDRAPTQALLVCVVVSFDDGVEECVEIDGGICESVRNHNSQTTVP